MYQQGIGAGLGGIAQSPDEQAKQQRQWEKERAEAAVAQHRAHVVAIAATLLAKRTDYDAPAALRAANDLIQGAKTFDP